MGRHGISICVWAVGMVTNTVSLCQRLMHALLFTPQNTICEVRSGATFILRGSKA